MLHTGSTPVLIEQSLQTLLAILQSITLGSNTLLITNVGMPLAASLAYSLWIQPSGLLYQEEDGLSRKSISMSMTTRPDASQLSLILRKVQQAIADLQSGKAMVAQTH